VPLQGGTGQLGTAQTLHSAELRLLCTAARVDPAITSIAPHGWVVTVTCTLEGPQGTCPFCWIIARNKEAWPPLSNLTQDVRRVRLNPGNLGQLDLQHRSQECICP
jgi:hypothetical protein